MNLDINGILDSVTGGSVIGGIADMFATNKATKALQHALDRAGGEINKGYDLAKEYYTPYYEQGTKAYKTLGDMINNGAFKTDAGEFTYDKYTGPNDFAYKEYTDTPFNFEADPGYEFRKKEGQGAIESSAAARGSQFSGATLKALEKYGQDYASNEYQNAYARYANDRNYNRNNYNTDRAFSYGNYLNNRNNYNQDRAFDYGVFNDSYNRRRASNLDNYNQHNNMANSGVNAGNSLAELAARRSDNLANIQVQKGNANAAKAQSYGNSIGSMFSTSSGGGGSSVSGLGLNSLFNNNNSGNANKAQNGVDYNYGNVQNSNTQLASNSSGGDDGLIGMILSLV